MVFIANVIPNGWKTLISEPGIRPVKFDSTTVSSKPIAFRNVVFYALPMTGTCFLFVPVQLLLAGLYVKYFGLSLETVATVVLVARIFDAITDPLIGYFSDRYMARQGTRKPWVIIGNVVLVISAYFLFVPPEDVSVTYFLGWYLAFYLSFTMSDIPHYAWGGEIAVDSRDKTRIYSVRIGVWLVGALLFSALPLLPVFEGQGFTPETMRWSVYLAALFLLPALLLCWRKAPNGRKTTYPEKDSLRNFLIAIFSNKPLLNILASIFLINAAHGIYIALIFIYADAYLNLGGEMPMIVLCCSAVSFLTCVIIYKISDKLKKVSAFTLCVVLSALGIGGLGLLMTDFYSLFLLILLMIVVSISDSIQQVVAASLLSDISDYGLWKFGADRGAIYFAAYAFSFKAGIAIGSAIGLGLVGYSGFDVSAAENSEYSILIFKWVISGLPIILLGLSLFFVLRTPIDARRHAIVQRRINQRLERQSNSHQNESESALHLNTVAS